MPEKISFEKLFLEAKKLIENGFSIIPVRMVSEGKMGAKTPLLKWTQYMSEIITVDELYKVMAEKSIPIGIAVVTGTVSGNMEVLDIDDKHYIGSGMRYLNELKTLYPDIYAKLRIEKTINHGFHIPYRISDGIAGRNQDLAKRYATDEELVLKPNLKEYCFIEIKGEGGKCVIPPTDGYSFLQELEIPTISQHERDIICSLAVMFNEVKKKTVKLNVSKTNFRNYSVSPWDDFNSSSEAEKILQRNGWEIDTESSRYIQFRKPDKKKGNSSSFCKKDRFYYIFTTSTQLDSHKGYSPSTLLCELEFNGDTKDCFKWLVSNGYGQLTEYFEEKYVKKSILNNLPLPANFSQKGKEVFKLESENQANKYPYGVFWEQTEKGDFKINKELILNVAIDFGFKKYKDNIVQIDEKIIENVNVMDFQQSLKRYIKEDDKNDFVAIQDKFEDYLQKSTKYLISRLPELNEDLILKDTRYVAYKCFSNAIFCVSKSEIKEINYDENEKLIFKNQIVDKDFKIGSEYGLFSDFLSKAILPTPHLKKYIGYNAHKYKDSSGSYATLLTEAVLNPKDGGGSGKNIFASLVGKFTSYLELPASQVSMDEKFFQSWNGENVMSLSDLPKNFDFQFLKNFISDSIIVKKLFKNIESINGDESPKLMMSTNYSYDISDGGVRRRVKVLEFTDFFTRCGGVDVHYNGKMFPQDFEDEDWNSYYNYMLNSIQAYLQNPKLENIELSETGWKKRFIQNNGSSALEFIEEYISKWTNIEYVSKYDFEKNYNDFCIENGVKIGFRKSTNKMNDAIAEFCEKYELEFNRSVQKRFSGHSNPVSCRLFRRNNAETNTTDIQQVKDDSGLPF